MAYNAELRDGRRRLQRPGQAAAGGVAFLPFITLPNADPFFNERQSLSMANIRQKLLALQADFLSIANRPDALPREVTCAAARGGRLVYQAFQEGLIVDESDFLKATEGWREPKQTPELDTWSWASFWTMFVFAMAKAYPDGGTDPLALHGGPQLNGVRIDQSDGKEWRIRARNYAYAAEWVAEHLATPTVADGDRQPQDTDSGQDAGQVPKATAMAADDFRSVNWYGTIYEFTATQAACVRVLWEHYQQRTPAVGEQTILDSADSSSDRLSNVFKTRKRYHPAWKAMIVPSGKGAFRLQKPSEQKT